MKIEPDFYVPILPMVLVNGAEGIGTGWSTKIPNYNPREIIQNLEHLLDGKDVSDLPNMVPWFKGFRGTIEELENHQNLRPRLSKQFKCRHRPRWKPMRPLTFHTPTGARRLLEVGDAMLHIERKESHISKRRNIYGECTLTQQDQYR